MLLAAPRFLLARHGETNFNKEGRIQGTLDSSVLTLDGISQVSALGYFLASSGEAAAVDATWCSPMQRARQSYAAVLGCASAAGVSLPAACVRHELREIELHEWEGLLKTEIDEEAWGAWKRRPDTYRAANGAAPLLDLWARAQGNWAAVRAGKSRCSFIMAHGALGRCMLGTALGLEPISFNEPSFEFENAALVEIEWPHDAAVATRWRKRHPVESEWMTAEDVVSSTAIADGQAF
ncbi:hypothetical protein AB1Y20_006863 [Prymnesium parvum]|uniref:Phosphoglycerate mutase n=1 Tax=Prymnesium parvum TaxID=97485 RepID=A0AB34J306_PRYPA